MADLSNDYYIVGTPNQYLYEPNAGYSEEEDSLANENSGRTDDGMMHITWVRTSYMKWNFTYQGLTASELQYMQSLLQGKTFTFHGLFHGKPVTKQCYCSNNSANVYMHQYPTSNGLFTDCTFHIIEM